MSRLDKADFTAAKDDHRPFAKLYKELFDYPDLDIEAILVYTLIREQANLSAHNNWLDDYGNVYCIYTVEKLAEKLRRSNKKISNSIKLLKQCGLIETAKNKGSNANIFYITDRV